MHKIQKCQLAYEELIQCQNMVIDKRIYCAWLEKHSELKQSLNISLATNNTDIGNFFWLYDGITDLKEFLQSDDFAKQAIQEFQTIEKSNEQQLLKWLVKYEKTGRNLTLFLYEYYEDDFPKDIPYYKISNLMIDKSDFKNIAEFKFLFDECYWNTLEKYNTNLQDRFSFRKEAEQSIKENHILNSTEKYQQYVQQYPKYLRKEPMLNSEEEFVNYLKNCDDFLFEYLKEYSEEEFHQYFKKEEKEFENSGSLTYHLKQRK